MKTLRKLIEKTRRTLAGLLLIAGAAAVQAQTASNFPVQKVVPGNLLVGSLSLSSPNVLTLSNGSELISLAGSIVDLRVGTVSLSGLTVSVSGQYPVNLTTTLSLSAGSNVTLTTNSGSNTITISSTSNSGTVTQVTAGAGLTATLTTSTPVLTLTTSIPVGNLAAGSGATSSTFWRGDGTWAAPSGGSGTVTSVVVSGGVTGLTFIGTNTTSTPSYTMSGTLSVGNGGTGVGSITGFIYGNGSSGFTATVSPSLASMSGTLAVNQGGTGTTSPGLVQGTNVTITGTWPNQTISSASNSGTVTGLTVSASSGLTVAVTTSLSVPQLTFTLSSNLLGWNSTSSASFPTFTQLSSSLSAYQLIVPNLTGWAATSSASYQTTAQANAAYQPLAVNLTGWAATSSVSYPTFANMTASFSSYPAASISGNIQTVSVSGQQLVTLTSGGTLALVAGSNITLTTNSTSRAITIAGTGSNSGTVTQVTAGAGLTATNTTSAPQLTLTTSIPVGNLAAGSGATSSTFWRGDGTWAAPSGGSSNPINLLITGSASPAVNSASLSFAPGITWTGSGSGTLSLSAGLNTFNTAASFSGPVNLTNVTDSTGTTSGSLILLGGAGIAKALTVGGNATVSGTIGNDAGTVQMINLQINPRGVVGSVGISLTQAGTATGSHMALNTSSAGRYDFISGGSTEAALSDGVAIANRFGISFGGNASMSMTIESNSGMITAYRGITISSSNASLIVGATGSAIKGIITGTLTLSSGAGTVTNSAFTTTSRVLFTRRTASVSGTVGIDPGATYNSGSFSAAATATDNSSYDYIFYVQ